MEGEKVIGRKTRSQGSRKSTGGKYEVLLIKKISWEYCLAREELLTRAEFKGSWGETKKRKMMNDAHWRVPVWSRGPQKHNPGYNQAQSLT